MEKKPTSRKPTNRVHEIKWLITSLSLAITLAVWNQFSRQLKQASAEAAANSTPAGQDIQPTQAVETTLILPPMPTLIPPAPVNGVANLPPAPQAAAPVQVVSQPVVVQPTQKKLILGAAPQPKARKPVTVTRSSHP
jgi:hypothetical protein